MARRACFFWFHRTVENKEIVLNQWFPQGWVQKEQTQTSIYQSFPERSLFAHFKSYCLRAWISISIHVGEGWDHSFRKITGLGTASITGSHYEQRWQLEHSQNFERWPRACARLNDKAHHLHENSLKTGRGGCTETYKESQGKWITRGIYSKQTTR